MGMNCPKCGNDCRLAAQAAWGPSEAESYVATPIPYEVAVVPVDGLELGLTGHHAYWKWKPYADRPDDHREDYDRLEASIRREGIKSAVIGWGHHVLIGQRRVEIARKLGIQTVPMVRILEDARRYWKWDMRRIDLHLRPVAGEVAY